MDPDQLARLELALEAQHRLIAGIRSRWDVARRIPPGSSTFWSGAARAGYELGVGEVHASALRASDALAAALAHTRTALQSVRP